MRNWSERIWDFTTIDTFLTCRRKFYFRMVKHYQPKVASSALSFGSAIHEGLDAYYTKGIESALEIFSENYKDRDGEVKRTVDNGKKLLSWYAKVYKNEPIKPLGKPEAGFVFPIGDIMWGGRMDLPVEWEKELWILEHKTTSMLTSTYFKQYKLCMQVTSYILGAEEYMGRECKGCIINVLEPWKELIRPTARSKKPEDHFARDYPTRSPRLKEMFKMNIQRHVRDILWCVENDEWAECCKRDVCWKYNSECPYINLCAYGESERFVKRDYDIDVWEPYKKEEVKDV